MLEDAPLEASTLLAAVMGSEVVGPASATLGSKGFDKLLTLLADSSQPVQVRSKLILTVSFLVAHSSRWLVLAVKAQLPSHAHRLIQEQVVYASSCVAHLEQSIKIAVPQLSAAAVASLGSGRPASARPTGQPSPYANAFNTLISLLSRARLRPAVLSRGVVEDLASCMSLCGLQDEEAVHAVLQCCEALVGAAASENQLAQQAVMSTLLPAIATFGLSASPGDTQWFALKIVCDGLVWCAQALNCGLEKIRPLARQLALEQIFPHLGRMFEDSDPALAIKLASCVTQCDSSLVQALTELFPKFFGFFDLKHPSNNKVLHSLLSF